MTRNRLNRIAMTSLAAAGLWLGLAMTPIASTPAAAQQGTINPEQACRDDAFRLCNNFIPDRDKVGACLRRNARSLSRDCRTVIAGGGGGHHRATRQASHRRRHR
jgi:hypothetical protein